MAFDTDNPAADSLPENPVESSVRIPAKASAASRRRYQYSAAAPEGNIAAAVRETDSGSALTLAIEPLPLQWNSILLALGIAAACFVLFYFAGLQQLFDRWTSDAGWSHGLVVPLISVFFIRLKWDTLRQLLPSGSWIGLVILAVGVGGQILFRATGLSHMSGLSILVVLFGTVLYVFGWEYLKVLWLPIGFLAFAIPPPQTLYVRITTPMQVIAAELGVQLLPFFGAEGVRSGTIIDVAYGSSHAQLNVEQACSGMRMLVAFFALAVALAYSTERPIWQKVTLALCALPIAIICNGLRVTLTGVLAVRVGGQWAEGKAHEYFGLLMLGPAMAMQLAIAWALDRLFVEVPDGETKRGAA